MTASPIANDFRGLRFARGEMTRHALADACGVTRQAIIAPQAGRCAPSPGPALRGGRAFGVGVKEVSGCRAQA